MKLANSSLKTGEGNWGEFTFAKTSGNVTRDIEIIGHLHDDVILLLRPESFRTLLSCAN